MTTGQNAQICKKDLCQMGEKKKKGKKERLVGRRAWEEGGRQERAFESVSFFSVSQKKSKFDF